MYKNEAEENKTLFSSGKMASRTIIQKFRTDSDSREHILTILRNVVSTVLALKDSPKHKRLNSLISCHRGYRKKSVP